MHWRGSVVTRGRCEGSRSRDYGLRSSSVELAVSHCTHSNDLSATDVNIILLFMFISPYKITANEIFQPKFCKKCLLSFPNFFYRLESYVGQTLPVVPRGAQRVERRAVHTRARLRQHHVAVHNGARLRHFAGMMIRKSEGNGESFWSRYSAPRIVTFSWFKWQL